MIDIKSASERMTRLLEALFLFSIVLIGWGVIVIHLPGGDIFRIYGCTWESYFPLYFLYLICRVVHRDFTFRGSIRDPLFLFAILALLSVLWNPQKDLSLFLDLYVPALMGYFIFRFLLEKDFAGLSRRFWPFLVASLALMVVRGIVENPNILRQPSSFLNSTLLHHNHIAMNLVMGLPLLTALLYSDRRHRVLFISCAAIMLPGLAFTNSRCGWIGCLCSMIYLAWKQSRIRIRQIALIMTSAALIIVALFSFSRALSIARPLSDSSFRCRINMWNVSLSMMREHPLLGIGFSNKAFTEQEAHYAPDLYRRGMIPEPVLADPHPHNLYIQIVVYLGLGGYLLLIWIIHDIVKALRTIGKKPDADPVMLTAFCAALTGFAVTNLADTVFNSNQSTLIMMLYFAYILEWARQVSKETAVPPAS